MPRDSLFGDRVLWTGQPRLSRCPLGYRLVAGAFGLVSLITLAFATVVSMSLHVAVGTMLVFAGWCATLALLAWRLPIVFRAGLQYTVTDRHVIWKRGKLRRSIERSSVSFARIVWNPRVPGVGDLVLVRAVPTGALRRTLTLTLSDVEAPDRLWAKIRGAQPSEAMGDGDRPVSQRLQEGERVLWSAIPLAAPWSTRRIGATVLSLLIAGAGLRTLLKVIPPVHRVHHSLTPFTFAILVVGVVLSLLLVTSAAVVVGYAAVVRPMRLRRETRYFVTSERVLIRRGQEELSLDRARIAYVITAPSGGRRLSDLFLVLDGPKARAMAMSGAFGSDASVDLEPVFTAIDDAETPHAILFELKSAA